VEITFVIDDEVIQSVAQEKVVYNLTRAIHAEIDKKMELPQTVIEQAVDKFLQKKFKEENIKTWIDEAVERILEEKLD